MNACPQLFVAVVSLGLPWGFCLPGFAATVAGLPDLAGLHVALDVGHNKIHPGAISARGRNEFAFNLDTVRSLAGVLRAAGARVTIINELGGILGLVERPQRAERLGADVFISIHHDSVNDKYLKTWEVDGKSWSYSDRSRGYSVFCSKLNVKAAQSRILAGEIGAAMLAAGFKPTPHHHEPIPGENRPFIDERTGVYEFSDLAVLKYSRLPSVLLECGVIVHREEEQEVQSPEYQRRIGMAVASALAAARKKGVLGPVAGRKPMGKLLKIR